MGLVSATGYFKVPTSRVPVAVDTCFPFDGRDAESIAAAWERAREMRFENAAPTIVRWGDLQIQGPWSLARRIDR